ncbi:MAG TPA: SIMPL domain-containing protein [Draconibacterium sp.]|nr:SIMPL domain-containing protein [Draconibacterium sp.]
MKYLLILTVFVFTFRLAEAQYVQPGQEKPYIEVVGNSEMEIVPNEIYISFTLKERMDGKKKITIEDQEKELKKQLQKAGFDLANLSLSDASAGFVPVKRKKQEVLTAKNYIIKVATTTEVASVFDVLDSVEALNADISRVAHSEIEKYRKEVKIMAVKAAKEKAGYLLEAIGESVGKPLMIQERESYDDVMPVANYRMKAMEVMAESDMAPEELPELSFQKIKLKYSVFARFEIK